VCETKTAFQINVRYHVRRFEMKKCSISEKHPWSSWNYL